MTSFITTFGIILLHTPAWVWALYALLLFLGFQRTRDSAVPLYRVLILPLVVTVFAISSLVGAGTSGLLPMLVGTLIGSAVGWQFERDGATRRLAAGRVWLRGDWWSFVQLVVVLIFRYATNATAAVNPSFSAVPLWHLGTLGISAALSGLFLGRAAARLRVYLAATPVLAP